VKGSASDFCKEGPGPGRRQAPPLPTTFTRLVGAELASALGLGGLAPRNNLTRTPEVKNAIDNFPSACYSRLAIHGRKRYALR